MVIRISVLLLNEKTNKEPTMKEIKSYDEFLKLTAKEADELVHEAMRMNKVNYVLDITKWLAKVQTEHVLNFIKVGAFEAKDLEEYARGKKDNN